MVKWHHQLKGHEFEQTPGDSRGSIPGSGRSPGGGHDNPFQCSCLENPMQPSGLQSMGSHRVGHDWATNTKQETAEDGGDWRAAVHWVAKSRFHLVTEQQPTTLVARGGFPSQATQGPWSSPFFPRLHPLSFPLYKLPLEPAGLPLPPLPQGSSGGSHLGQALKPVYFLSSSLREWNLEETPKGGACLGKGLGRVLWWAFCC